MSQVLNGLNGATGVDVMASPNERGMVKQHRKRLSSYQQPSLGAILQAGSPKMENLIRKRVAYSQDADDIIQQAYLEAWKSRRNYNSLSGPETWICGIAVNMVRKYFQKKKVLNSIENIDDMSDEEYRDTCPYIPVSFVDPSAQAEQAQLLKRAMLAISQLPSDMRSTMFARVESEGSYEETASTLGIAVGTVRSRLSRARCMLRAQGDAH